MHRTLVSTVLAGGLLVGSAGAASAHECFVANRSERGNLAASSHSENWYLLTLEELFASAHFFLPVEELSAEQLDEALAMAEAQGIPLSFTLFERFTIPRSVDELTASPKSGDGKGIDHFFQAYGDQIIGIVLAVGTPTEAA
jgi:hypothetical protein